MGLYITLSVLIFLCCLLLAVIVLVQNPKGGGLSQTFGGAGNQIMGARKTADFLERATWTLAIALCSLSIISAFSIPRGTTTGSGISTEITVDETAMPQLPTMPTAVPAPAEEAAPAE
ncbi:MAG: preprotein translocase subunit SecG [Bacteroidales bacterium]|jgi:preprotein translocase subunit SecG|nr:preprotein translocase subunit SecG [Bacteroidales bacterium]